MDEACEGRRPVEEVANCITHGVGLVLSIAGLVALVVVACMYGGALQVVSGSVYGASLVILYTASTLYHGARSPRRKRLLQVVDHCGIYLLIAGTYTPFTLITLRGGWGWTLFGLVWGRALAGILFRVLFGDRYRPGAGASYVLLGWLCVIAVKPIHVSVRTRASRRVVQGGADDPSGNAFVATE